MINLLLSISECLTICKILYMELCDVNNLYSLIILLVSDEFEELTQKKKGSKQKAKSVDGAIGKKSKK